MRKKLSDEEISSELTGLTGWTREGDTLHRTVTMPSFTAAIGLVNGVAAAAEEMDHHPDMDIRYNRVSFALSTHSAGGLTALDFGLARRIDGLAG